MRNIVNGILRILGVTPGPLNSKEEAIEKREKRIAAKRAAKPEKLRIPGHATNRAARRLARKNGIKDLNILLLMQRAGLVEAGERRINKDKIASFVESIKADQRLREKYGLKDDVA